MRTFVRVELVSTKHIFHKKIRRKKAIRALEWQRLLKRKKRMMRSKRTKRIYNTAITRNIGRLHAPYNQGAVVSRSGPGFPQTKTKDQVRRKQRFDN